MKHSVGRSGSVGQQLRSMLRNAVVPHRHNDYRPHLSRWTGVSLVLAGVIVLQFSYNFLQTGSVLGRATSVSTEELLAVTNAERGANGELPLLINAQLEEAAEAKLDDMFRQQYWAHTSPDGVSPWRWVRAAGYDYVVAGENLARDFSTSDGVVAAWMNSPEHRENMLDGRYRDVGFASKTALFDGNERTMIVALYGTPNNGQVVAGAKTQTAQAETDISPIAQLGVGVRSLSPAAVGSIVLLLVAAVAALGAHSARSKLPYSWRQSWRRHHGIYSAAVSVCVIVVTIALYGGGQI